MDTCICYYIESKERIIMQKETLKELLEDLSLEEKIGQLVQVAGNLYDAEALVTGELDYFKINEEELDLAGSILSISGAEKLRKLQDSCMEKQPHHIPLMFMLDIINGYDTIYPVPIAQGATFNPELSEELAQMAAKEGAAAGLHVTFSPMTDLVRDARWGRVMESTGEDAYLNGLMGAAMVRGYQGNDIREKGRLAACVKHFAAYGAPEAGRDYDTVELSERTLLDEYLPAYEECVKAGVKLVMTSFNTINRVPSSGNKWLMREVLRDKMGFDGVLISDYGAVKEMVNHNIARDETQAGYLAIRAGVDIEMMSLCYARGLKGLLEEGKISQELIDEAVWRVLVLKNELGLVENPYKDADVQEEKEILLCAEHRELARKGAVESFVLLKNEENILPLTNTKEKVAFVGPYVENHQVFGSWSFPKREESCVTVRQGVENRIQEGKLDEEQVTFVHGGYLFDQDKKMKNGVIYRYEADKDEAFLKSAMEAAKTAKAVVLCLGEHSQQTGEAASRTRLSISESQMRVLREVSKINSNVVTVLFNGRPLELEEITKLSKAVLVAWFPGTECGNALADVLFGDKEPGGRLPMSFPYHVGQLPCYYNRFPSGRPNDGTLNQGFVMGYIDQIDRMLYPFGSGMGYTQFTYGKVELSGKELKKDAPLTASITITNSGHREGTETVQLYVSDLFGTVVRPVKQLKGFKKVTLKAGESKKVSFEIKEEMFRFYNIDMEYTSEAGTVRVAIGHDSNTDNWAYFELAE